MIGGGPGGLVSALYLRRFLRSVVVVNSGRPRASWIPRTHNLLGHPKGISGPRLLNRLREQITELKTEQITGEYRVFPEAEGFRLVAGDDSSFTAHRVILATGMRDVQPVIENLDTLRRRGLLRYCPVCDAFEYRRKKIAVLAQDPHGVRTAIFLSRFSDRVFLIWPPSQALSTSQKNLLAKNGIQILTKDILQIEERAGSRLWFVLGDEGGRGRGVAFDICYVAMGVTVNELAFRHLKSLRRTDDGHLITDSHRELHVPGLFAVGDCSEGLAQISVAAGHAAIAATRLHNQLTNHPSGSK